MDEKIRAWPQFAHRWPVPLALCALAAIAYASKEWPTTPIRRWAVQTRVGAD
jgi:hypothetical protein